jgi:hypothetical protein
MPNTLARLIAVSWLAVLFVLLALAPNAFNVIVYFIAIVVMGAYIVFWLYPRTKP